MSVKLCRFPKEDKPLPKRIREHLLPSNFTIVLASDGEARL